MSFLRLETLLSPPKLVIHAELKSLLDSKNVGSSIDTYSEDVIALFNESFLLTDPDLPDNPIVYSSPKFTGLTGYSHDEIIGKNCRFLQGPETDPNHIEYIRKLIKTESQGIVKMINYRKDNSTFLNTFMLIPIKVDNKTVFYLGALGFQSIFPKFDEPSSAYVPWPSNLILKCGAKSDVPNKDVLSFSNMYASGSFLLKTRQPQMSENVEECFRDNNELFEFQLQLKLSRELPKNLEFFVGIEVMTPVELSFAVNYYITSPLLIYVTMFNSNFHISYGDELEYSHLSFPLHLLPENFIITPENKVPPALCLGKLEVPPRNPKVQVPIVLEVGKTYTMNFTNEFIFLEKWTLVNVPGIREIMLTKLWGNSNPHLVLYAVPSGVSKHLNSERIVLFDVEVCHRSFK